MTDPDHLISRYRQKLRVWNRRRKLERGYQKIAEAEMDKGYGFTPVIHAWSLMERDGHIEIEDGEKKWKFP